MHTILFLMKIISLTPCEIFFVASDIGLFSNETEIVFFLLITELTRYFGNVTGKEPSGPKKKKKKTGIFRNNSHIAA